MPLLLKLIIFNEFIYNYSYYNYLEKVFDYYEAIRRIHIFKMCME